MTNRALTLATMGLLSGAAITLASHGLIQTGTPDVPMPPPGGGHVIPIPSKYTPANRLRLYREDAELMELVALLVTRILK